VRGTGDVPVPRLGAHVKPSTLKEFEAMVRKDFAGPGPMYVQQTTSRLAATLTNPHPALAPNTSSSPIPPFDPRQASLPKSTPPPPMPINPASAYVSPPATLDTPGGCTRSRHCQSRCRHADDRRERQDRIAIVSQDRYLAGPVNSEPGCPGDFSQPSEW
jgi:hypothetical protein